MQFTCLLRSYDCEPNLEYGHRFGERLCLGFDSFCPIHTQLKSSTIAFTFGFWL